MKPQELTIGQKAKSILLERGWRQEAYDGTKPGHLCMVEALGRATATDFEVARAIKAMGFCSNFQAVQWNDTPGRTFEEVLERLDRV